MADIDERARSAKIALPQKLLIELAQLLRFYSRLPLPRLPFESDAHAPPDFRKSVRMLPLASFSIAMPGALVLGAASLFWLPAMLCALLGIATSIIVTGALHEDGLADTADGIGGGATIERRLAIMRDSRIGTFGALALVLVMGAKVICLSAIIDRYGAQDAMLAFLGAAIASRVTALLPHWLLPPARDNGRAAEVGRPEAGSVAIAAGLTMLFIAFALHGIGAAKLLIVIALTIGAALAVTALARRRLGGHTGDVIGATQQIAEVAFLIGLNASFYR